MARAGAPEGLWLRAERQTAGRGRQGRRWLSPAGNLYASTIVRLRRDDPPAPSLALVAAVALAEAIGGLGASARIKWPNDLLAGDAKLSGILLERVGDAVIVGLGVNLAHHPRDVDRPATSVAALTGHAPDPATFLLMLAEIFESWVARWRSEGLAVVLDQWLVAAHPAGTPLSVRESDGAVIDGRFDGLDSTGALRLRLADGSVRVIHAGDVFLIGD